MEGQQESYEDGLSPEIATGGGGKLREKLEYLYKVQEEIAEDIKALERSRDLLGEDSP